MKYKQFHLNFFDKLFVGILCTIFVGIVVHAPLTIWLGTFYAEHSLFLKSWKEILMGAAFLVGLIVLAQRRKFSLLLHPLVLISLLYALIHILLISYSYANTDTVLAGLLIDLRYVLFFALVMVAALLYPQLRKVFVWLFIIGAAIVCGFAVLQVFILPPDILSTIGYGKTTISPYLTVDENPEYIRINSTLRGPNPLGAYGLIVTAFVTAYLIAKRKAMKPKATVLLSLLGIASIIAVWASYSRSALVGLAVALGIVFLFTIGRKVKAPLWIGLFVVTVLIIGGVYGARDTPFVSNVLLHENEGTGAEISSNQGHIDSLEDGVTRLTQQPIGAGIGSTGSASLYSSEPVIIENQYLFIAHEVGWIGLALFGLLFTAIIWQLFKRRHDWLALSVFASGIGLALIGLLLPVWVDDTVSIIWWGLAAIVIGGPYVRTINKTSKRTA